MKAPDEWDELKLRLDVLFSAVSIVELGLAFLLTLLPETLTLFPYIQPEQYRFVRILFGFSGQFSMPPVDPVLLFGDALLDAAPSPIHRPSP